METPMNKYEKVCKEWLKGCSCANDDHPEECKECTDAFMNRVKEMGYKEDGVKIEWDHGVHTDEWEKNNKPQDKPENTITVAQAYMAKKVLCQRIVELLIEFEGKTGLKCLDVRLERQSINTSPEQGDIISRLDVVVKL